MSHPSSGIIGKIAAQRPLLLNVIVMTGLVALAIGGVRRAGSDTSNLIFDLGSFALATFAAPYLILSIWPKDTRHRIIAICVAAGLAVIVAVFASRFSPVGAPKSATIWVVAMIGYVTFLAVLATSFRGILRLSATAPLASLAATLAVCGYMALEGTLETEAAAAVIILTLVAGLSVGAGAAADFVKYFANGAPWRTAAIGAGHSGVATSVFGMLVTAISIGVLTVNSNFGAVDWHFVWAGFSGASLASAAALFAVVGGIILSREDETAAEIENRRRRNFRASWKPIRLLLPPATAMGVLTVALVLVVISLFEAGFALAKTHFVYFLLIWATAALVFVSVRAATLITLLILIGAVLADYMFVVLGAQPPSFNARLTALALGAISLAQLTISWRDARDDWRGMRDIAENALSDGARRFALVSGAATSGILVVSEVFGWEEGFAAIAYFTAISAVSATFAPALMTALSFRFR